MSKFQNCLFFILSCAILLAMKDKVPAPKGILFDMDGVLLIATQSSDQSWRLVCQQFAPQLGLPVQRLEEVLRTSRRAYHKDIEHDIQKQRRDRLEPFETRRETVERALIQAGRANSSLATEIVRIYESLREEHRQLAPFALETLQKLRNLGFPLALISNGNATYQRQKIQQHRLAPFFQSILIEEEFGVAKPDSRIFLAALQQLGIANEQAWMIGDNLLFDIAASQQLNIFAIWCDLAQHRLSEEQSVHPDRVIHALPEIIDLLGECGNFI